MYVVPVLLWGTGKRRRIPRFCDWLGWSSLKNIYTVTHSRLSKSLYTMNYFCRLLGRVVEMLLLHVNLRHTLYIQSQHCFCFLVVVFSVVEASLIAVLCRCFLFVLGTCFAHVQGVVDVCIGMHIIFVTVHLVVLLSHTWVTLCSIHIQHLHSYGCWELL